MKRIVSILLICVLMLGMVSCKINKEEIHVIWSDLEDQYLATIADAVDRAMYIKNIRYRHVDSEGSATKQLEQVDDALAGGAGIVVVSAVDAATSALIVAKAQAKDAYVVFLCCDIMDAVVMAYEKSIYINVDPASLVEALGDRIVADVLENYDDYDRNGDGKISYLPVGVSDELAGCVLYVNDKLSQADRSALELHEAVLDTSDMHAVFSQYNDENKKTPELLLVADDDRIESVLFDMRRDGMNFNYTKLKTHFIPMYTVGIAAAAGKLIPDKGEEERAAYSVMNAIDNGFVSAAALEDDDELALALCTVLSNIVKEKDLFNKVNDEYLNGNKIFVPYTIYG